MLEVALMIGMECLEDSGGRDMNSAQFGKGERNGHSTSPVTSSIRPGSGSTASPLPAKALHCSRIDLRRSRHPET